MHFLAPLLVSTLLAAGSTSGPGGAAEVSAAAPTAPEPQRAEPTLRLPRPAIQAAVEVVLRERGRLRRFQLGTSKFSDGRCRLDELRLLPSTEPGVARFEIHGGLNYARRQLGVRWRGLKSHKKWYDRGRKDVARVRITGEARLVHGALATGERPAIELGALRVKLVSRLTPARGLTARFDVKDRRFEVPEGVGAWFLDGVVIQRSDSDAIVLGPRRTGRRASR